jgi:hypothetical protein
VSPYWGQLISGPYRVPVPAPVPVPVPVPVPAPAPVPVPEKVRNGSGRVNR